MWNRGDVDFVQTQQLAWERVPDGLFCAGELRKVLSADPQGACTWLVQIRNPTRGTIPAGADVYTLSGSGSLNQFPLHPDGYVHLPPGARFTVEPHLGPLVVYVGFFGEPVVRPPVDGEDTATGVAADEGTWVAPTWTEQNALPFGAFVKVLRSDSLGEAYVTFMRPGWSSPMEERHPNHEESFRIYGDLLQGWRGLMRAGAYSFRSPGVWHAPLYTRTGTMSFIRTSGPTVTEYREPAAERGCQALVARAYSQFAAPSVT